MIIRQLTNPIHRVTTRSAPFICPYQAPTRTCANHEPEEAPHPSGTPEPEEAPLPLATSAIANTGSNPKTTTDNAASPGHLETQTAVQAAPEPQGSQRRPLIVKFPGMRTGSSQAPSVTLLSWLRSRSYKQGRLSRDKTPPIAGGERSGGQAAGKRGQEEPKSRLSNRNAKRHSASHQVCRYS